MTEEDAILYRWEQWRRANTQYPGARENEIRRIYTLAHPRPGEKIWESGTGNGCLTLPLIEAVGETGEVVSTDVQPENIKELQEAVTARGLAVKALLLPVEQPLLSSEQYENYFDAVCSIATLHHFDDRLKRPGESGRIEALETFYRMLRPGGRLILSDVLGDTETSRYFDTIDTPERAAPRGHPHDFFTKERLLGLLQNTGFKNIRFECTDVPWKFVSEEEARWFVHTLHNATVSEEESFAVAKKMLGFKEKDGHYELGWGLFFLEATK